MSPDRPSETVSKLPVPALAIRQLDDVARQTRLINGIFAALNSSIKIDDLLLMLLTILTTPRGLGFTRAHLFTVEGNPRQATGHLALGCETEERLMQLEHEIREEEEMLATMARRGQGEGRSMSDELDDLRFQTWWITAFQRADADNPIARSIGGRELYRDNLRATPPLLAEQGDIFTQHVHTATDKRRLNPETVELLGEEFLLAPLRTKRGVRAIVAVDKRFQGSSISPTECANLEWLCNQASLALENAELYEDLQRAYHEIEAVDQMKSNFLSTISHELRTPLTSILGFAQIILAGRAGDVNAEIKRLLEKVVDKTRDLHSMVNDILEITEIQAGGLVHLGRHPVRIEPLIDKVLERITMRRMVNDVRIRHEHPSAPLPAVLGDEQAIERVIYHIVDNAVKFIPVKGEVVVSHRLAGNRLEVSVADTGIGIAPEHLDNIFEHFYQVESDLSRSYSGVGLGLTITKRLVDLLEATIDVTSQPGSGSTFCVGFPLAATGERSH